MQNNKYEILCRAVDLWSRWYIFTAPFSFGYDVLRKYGECAKIKEGIIVL